MTEELAPVRLTKTSLDLIEQVKPVQGIFESSVVGEVFNGP